MAEQQQIYKLIPIVMKAVGSIAKSKNAPATMGGYAFRGIDQVYDALQPAFIEHGVFIVPEALEWQTKDVATKNGGTAEYVIVRMAFNFTCGDGSFIRAVTVGEGMDHGDKAANKAMSAAFKYACFQVFCIAVTDGAADAEFDSIERRSNNARQPHNRPQPQQPKADSAPTKIVENQKKALAIICKDLGVSEQSLCQRFTGWRAKVFSELTFQEAVTAIKTAKDTFATPTPLEQN